MICLFVYNGIWFLFSELSLWKLTRFLKHSNGQLITESLCRVDEYATLRSVLEKHFVVRPDNTATLTQLRHFYRKPIGELKLYFQKEPNKVHCFLWWLQQSSGHNVYISLHRIIVGLIWVQLSSVHAWRRWRFIVSEQLLRTKLCVSCWSDTARTLLCLWRLSFLTHRILDMSLGACCLS